MIQTSKNLINLPVFTESGEAIGHLVDFNIETESQSIIDYLVRPHNLISGLLNNELVINRGQIVDIQKNKIIVSDNTFTNQRKSRLLTQKEKKTLPVTEKNL